MANNASAEETGNTTPVSRTGRQRKPNMRFADYEMDDTVRKIVTGVSTPPEGALKKGSGRGSSGGRKDGSGQRKDGSGQQKTTATGKRKEKLEDEKGLERVLADSAGTSNMAATSGTVEEKKVPKNVKESPSSGSSNSRRSTRGQPYTSPIKDDVLKDSGVSLTLVPAKQEKIKKKFNLDTLKGRKFPVKGNMVVLDMKQSSIVTVKPKQIKDLIQLESKSNKVPHVPVKLETESVKLDDSGPPIKLSVTKLMCEELSETEERMSGSELKNIFKIGDIDCDAKSMDEKAPLLLRESDFSGFPTRISLNEDNKVREKLVSNLGNIDNERKMEYDIFSDQVKPARRGRRKLPASQDGTDQLDELADEAAKESNNKGNQEKTEMRRNQSNNGKDLIKQAMLSDNDTKSETVKTSFFPVKGEEVNVTSKRERNIEQKKIEAESNKLQSKDSPKLKKQKTSEDSVIDTDKQKDNDLEDEKSTLEAVKEKHTVKIESKFEPLKKDLKKEKGNKTMIIENTNKNLEKDIKKHEENEESISSTLPKEIIKPTVNKEEVFTNVNKSEGSTSLTCDVKNEVGSEKSQMTVKKEIKKEGESIPSVSKRKCDEKEINISERENKGDGIGFTKKLKVNNDSSPPGQSQSVFKDTDEEMEVPKDMMGIAHLMSFLRRPASSSPQKEKPVEVKKEVAKKAEEKSFIKKKQVKKTFEKVTMNKDEENKEVVKIAEENIDISEKSEENNGETRKVEKKNFISKFEEKKNTEFTEEEKPDKNQFEEMKDIKFFAEIENEKVDVKITEEKHNSPSKIVTKVEDTKIVAKMEIENKKEEIKVTEEKNKSPDKIETKIEIIKKTEGKKENLEKKKVDSPSKLLMSVKKSEKISPKKVESPLAALMHEGKGEKRKKEETKKIEEKKKDEGENDDEEIRGEEERVKEEKVLETKSKKIKLEDNEVQRKDDESKKKVLKREQEKTLSEKGKKPKEENTELKADVKPKENIANLSPEKKHEIIMDKVKIEDTKESNSVMLEEKNKTRKVSRSTSNSPCRLLSQSRKSSKDKEVKPLDLLMKNVKETDTESDGSLNEIIQKKVGKRNKSLTKGKTGESESDNLDKGKKKEKDDQGDQISPKKEGMGKKIVHIDNSIDNAIGEAMTEEAPNKVVEKKKEKIMEKDVKDSKSEYNSPKIEVKKEDEKSKTPGKRKMVVKNKTEAFKQTDDKRIENEKKEGKFRSELEKKKLDDEKRKKDEKRKIEEEKKQTEDEKKRKGGNVEDNKSKLEEEKRKKNDDKKKAQTNNDNSIESSKSSPAQKKMSQSTSNSPSRSTPRVARKLYKSKDEDIKKNEEDEKKKEHDEKKKENEKVLVKEESGFPEKKKKDGKKKEEEKKDDCSIKNIKDNDIQDKDDITTEINNGEEGKIKKNDDKKKNVTNEAAKSSPAQRKMSRSASNSPSRPTPRSARKLYKDEDLKKKDEEEKKKDNEKVLVKEEIGNVDNKKKEERSVDSSHKNKKDKEIDNKEDISMEVDDENILETKKVKKDSDILKIESSKEPRDSKENVLTKEEKIIKIEEMEPELTQEERLEAEKKKKSEEEEREKRNQAVVDVRMKSFVHLSENLYISERKKSKRNKELRRMTCDCYLTKDEISAGEVGCGEDCLNRLLMVECGSRCKTKEHCSNKRFQMRENADVEVFNADEKGCGVRARTDIEAGTFLMEYIGEVFDTREFKRRRREYAKDGGAHFYFMSLRSDELIDATRKGNISRFVNHSCDPVAETQKWTVNGDLRIGFFSKKSINAGEEITFDYRMERYGREPQKCYCGTSICRGWLGEAPDQKTKEEKEEDKKKEEKEKKRQERRTSDDMDKMVEKDEEKEKRDRRKLVLDDMDLEDEIEKLGCVGLRNRQDTLNLSRLMVRAMDEQSRFALLRLLREGEPACRRLFLDYHGLRVLWSWMADIGSQQDNVKLKMEILTTLGDLPITNKTQLIDSRVLNYVEKWSQLTDEQITATSPLKTPTTPQASPSTKKISDASEDSDTELEGSGIAGVSGHTSRLKTVESSSTDDSSSLDSNDVTTATHKSSNTTDERKVDDDNSDSNLSLPTKSSSASSSSSDVSPSDSQEKLEQTELAQNVVDTTLKLLNQWKNLKEAFRIPKKERIEMMKEHERQVDRDYQEFLVRDTTLDRGKSRSSTPSYYSSRIIRRSPDRDRDRHRARRNNNNNNNADNDTSGDWSNLSKEERRQQFALKVQQEEEEANIRKEEEAAQRKMQEEMWQLHVDRCNLLCQDPYLTPILDPTCQYFWDPKENNWQPYTGPVPDLGLNPASEGDSNSSSPQVQGPNSVTTSPRSSNIPWVTPSQPLPGNLAPDSDPAHPTGTNTSTFPGGSLGIDEDPLNPANIPLPGETSHVPQCSPNKITTPGGEDTSPQGTSIISSIPLPGEMARMSTLSTPTAPGTPVSTDLLPLGTMVGVDEGLPPPTPVGPITITLPPKWKIARDPRGHIYFYHTKTRISQWDIPTIEQHKMMEQTMNIHQDHSDSDSVSSSDSDSSDSTDSEEFSSDEEDEDEDEEVKVLTADDPELDEKMIRCPKGRKKRSAALVQERVISPICEIDREEARKERHKAKERAREEARQERHDRRQERVFDQGPQMQQQTYEDERQRREEKKSKTRHKDRAEMKERLSYALADNSDRARKIKENFKVEVAMFIVQVLNPYRRSDCQEGKIKTIDDFKYLGKKLTHFVLVKELRQLPNMEALEFSESVKNKTKDFINKYMKKFGDIFKRDPNDTKDYS